MFSEAPASQILESHNNLKQLREKEEREKPKPVPKIASTLVSVSTCFESTVTPYEAAAYWVEHWVWN